MLIDTHSHLNFPDYDGDREAVIKRTLDAGIAMINVGCDYNSSCLGVLLAKKYPQDIFAAVGLHPTNVSVGDAQDFDSDPDNAKEIFNAEEYKSLATQSKKVVAVGETGLDYYRLKQKNAEAKKVQMQSFEGHIKLAAMIRKPLIVHVRDVDGSRKAHNDVLKILISNLSPCTSRPNGTIHSFSGDLSQAKKYIALGFKISFNGIITFSRDYDEVVKNIPLESILLETDCPFLTPVPYRGKRNEPVYMIEVAKKLAELRDISYEEVAHQTNKNAKEVFGI